MATKSALTESESEDQPAQNQFFWLNKLWRSFEVRDKEILLKSSFAHQISPRAIRVHMVFICISKVHETINEETKNRRRSVKNGSCMNKKILKSGRDKRLWETLKLITNSYGEEDWFWGLAPMKINKKTRTIWAARRRSLQEDASSVHQYSCREGGGWREMHRRSCQFGFTSTAKLMNGKWSGANLAYA